MVGFLFTYLLGAFTFWPILAGLVYYFVVYLDNEASKTPEKTSNTPKDDEDLQKVVVNSNLESLQARLDRDSNIEASGWLRVAPTYINKLDNFEEPESQREKPVKSSKSTLRRFMSGRLFKQSDPVESSLKREDSNSSLNSVNSSTSGVGSGSSPSLHNGSGSGNTLGSAGSEEKSPPVVPIKPPKTVSKCPKYWAVVRGGQLQLFEDASEKKIMDIITLPNYVVMLWPHALQEFELFYKRYPICLVSRYEPEGLISLDLYPGFPPKDAYYLYLDNGYEKEDMYFALIRESARKLTYSGLKPPKWQQQAEKLSLGPRDPKEMARPYRALRGESQALQSKVWNNETKEETQMLNGVLGRIFLAVKNTPVLDNYLRKKFAYKLKPISMSSNIIGDIDIKSIDCGTAAPLITYTKLKELTNDGNLVASVGVSYSGGFKVILGTKVRLSAISSLTSAEIPVELACTVTKLEGSMTIHIKPAPSDRIWYSFESMPDVDLQISPTVYHKNISLSVVTKFIKSKLLDSLRDSLVHPYMDDLSFYNSAGHFYRGGIWFPARPPTEREAEEEEIRATNRLKAEQPGAKVAKEARTPAEALKPTTPTKARVAPATTSQSFTSPDLSQFGSALPSSDATSVSDSKAPRDVGVSRDLSFSKGNPSIAPKPLNPTSSFTTARKPTSVEQSLQNLKVRHTRTSSNASDSSTHSHRKSPPLSYTRPPFQRTNSGVRSADIPLSSSGFDISKMASSRFGAPQVTPAQATSTQINGGNEGEGVSASAGLGINTATNAGTNAGTNANADTNAKTNAGASAVGAADPASNSFDFTSSGASYLGANKPKISRKPVPSPRPQAMGSEAPIDEPATTQPVSQEPPKLELPSFTRAADPVTDVSAPVPKGELIEDHTADGTDSLSERRLKQELKHDLTDGRSDSRRTSRPSSIRRRPSLDAQSVHSAASGSSKAPSLPPRNRRTVPLANVAPEHS